MESLKNPPLTTPKRKIYIDWMKAFGMLFIIWGHCKLQIFSPFVYAFNVPIFFVVSGFLTKKDENHNVFFTKLFLNYIVPFIVLAIVKDLKFLFEHTSDGKFLWSVLAIFGGFHSIGDVAGCLTLWFVYSIMVLKIIFHFIPKNKYIYLLIICISTMFTLIYRYFQLKMYWGVTNAIIGLPFFFFGVLLQNYNDYIEKFNEKGRLIKIISFLLSFVSVWFIANYNEETYLYKGDCGKNLLFCYLIGFVGTFGVFALSSIFYKRNLKPILLISIGTLVILTFHQNVNHPLLKLVNNIGIENLYLLDIIKLICSLLSLSLFVPIILIIKKFLPFLIGNRAKSI